MTAVAPTALPGAAGGAAAHRRRHRGRQWSDAGSLGFGHSGPGRLLRRVPAVPGPPDQRLRPPSRSCDCRVPVVRLPCFLARMISCSEHAAAFPSLNPRRPQESHRRRARCSRPADSRGLGQLVPRIRRPRGLGVAARAGPMHGGAGRRGVRRGWPRARTDWRAGVCLVSKTVPCNRDSTASTTAAKAVHFIAICPSSCLRL